jgi:rRNA maturation endonuclease Nob1
MKDLIKCVDCGKINKIEIGGEFCPDCGSSHLLWANEENKEVDDNYEIIKEN